MKNISVKKRYITVKFRTNPKNGIHNLFQSLKNCVKFIQKNTKKLARINAYFFKSQKSICINTSKK